jgi:hypothetical protein
VQETAKEDEVGYQARIMNSERIPYIDVKISMIIATKEIFLVIF